MASSVTIIRVVVVELSSLSLSGEISVGRLPGHKKTLGCLGGAMRRQRP